MSFGLLINVAEWLCGRGVLEGCSSIPPSYRHLLIWFWFASLWCLTTCTLSKGVSQRKLPPLPDAIWLLPRKNGFSFSWSYSLKGFKEFNFWHLASNLLASFLEFSTSVFLVMFCDMVVSHLLFLLAIKTNEQTNPWFLGCQRGDLIFLKLGFCVVIVGFVCLLYFCFSLFHCFKISTIYFSLLSGLKCLCNGFPWSVLHLPSVYLS